MNLARLQESLAMLAVAKQSLDSGLLNEADYAELKQRVLLLGSNSPQFQVLSADKIKTTVVPAAGPPTPTTPPNARSKLQPKQKSSFKYWVSKIFPPIKHCTGGSKVVIKDSNPVSHSPPRENCPTTLTYFCGFTSGT